ncbi:hypothetical protein [Falsirhodobacter xinxiangensis]|uniref:hypothetical protein n=1 Tax=Falsirhodobacter xinxiangensis TaxID=2530049 RepID=UPI0010AB4BEC|nr:hypothetical protein [Rhodobacter xinxiangensis]
MHTETTTPDPITIASDLILSTARDTVRATRKAHGRKAARKAAARMEAANALRLAAEELYEVAGRIAAGEPVKPSKRGAQMTLSLRGAEAKMREGQMRMAGTWTDLPLF